MPPEIAEVVARFDVPGRLLAVEPLAGGHINRSFVVTLEGDAGTTRYVLQRLNRSVFARPELVMENITRVVEHIARRLEAEGTPDRQRRVMRVFRTQGDERQRYYSDETGECWRMCGFVEDTRSFVAASDPAQARAAARAFGEFHRLLSDFPADELHETIPRFHDTPMRLEQFERAVAADACGRVSAVGAEIACVRRHADLADTLMRLLESGDLQRRVVHNDAKISNVLFDARSGEALCVVDLDTVMPGTMLFDFGDMMRSMSSTAAEDEPDAGKVTVDAGMLQALIDGYVESAGGFLTATEREHLLTAGKVITFEQAVRFLGDYVAGDVYYRTEYEGHNLVRARTQLRLLDDLSQK
ncbi:MAG: aminoglycoside phosphotransferase family protein [Phycisphaerae bacterium]|nr:aminoglycoside phosphotransferase family protein [Phycisphaerae bacterium]